jgi:aryl-alcohol dehydrogenase-like predicted oxidoreductase
LTTTVIADSELGRIVFGCGNFGGLGSSPALRDKGDDRERALALLDHARGLGLTRFDSANTYGGGVSETVLGEWLARQDLGFRSRIEVATKVGNPVGATAGERPLSRGQVAFHLDESLRRLGLEQISLYYLHEFDPSTPLEETLEALGAALAAGKIARFGVSNATVSDLEAVLRLVSSGPLAAAFTHVQNGFNRLETGDLDSVIPLVRERGLRYVAFSPLAGGLLSGKYQLDRPPEPGTRLDAAPALYEHLMNPATFEAIADLQTHAIIRGWTLPAAALRFILDTPGVDSLIVAPRSVEQFAAYGIGAP